MSMPAFPKPESILSRDQAINAILASIAIEETAIGHVIEAESEKIQYVIERAKVSNCGCADMQKILEVNRSVANLIEKATAMQIVLKDKLATVLKYLPPHPHPPKPPYPPIPPKPPCPPSPPPCQCTSVFSAIAESSWSCGTTLQLKETKCCKNGVKLCQQHCDTLILLPDCKKYKIEFEMTAMNKSASPIIIEMEFRKGKEIIQRESIARKDAKCFVQMAHSFMYKTPCDAKTHSVAIRLLTPQNLNVIRGKVMVTAS